MINNFDAQHYASLYCQYDKKSGNRNWKELLEQNTVETIDLLIAKNALKAQEKEVEVQRIIYYGSPLGQQLTEENRVRYSFQVTALALFPNIISVISFIIYHLTFIIGLEVGLKPLPNFFLPEGRGLKPKCSMFNDQCSMFGQFL